MIAMRVKKAFTMVEMLIVIMLLGVVMAFVVPQITKYLGKAGKAKIELRFAEIKQALNEYKMEFGMFPTTKEGLQALVTNPRPNDDRFKRKAHLWPIVAEDKIADDQGNPFEYRCPPEKNKGKFRYFEIIYLGPSQTENDPDRIDDGV